MDLSEKTYMGKPCKLGHEGIRYKSTRTCKICSDINARISHKNNYNSEKSSQETSLWRANNPDKVKLQQQRHRRKHPEIYALASKKWKSKNKDKLVLYTNKRRTNYLGTYTREDVLNILNFQEYKCCYCRKSFNEVPYTIDHIKPISKEGTNFPDNIQLLCLSCNCSKGNKTVEEWLL